MDGSSFDRLTRRLAQQSSRRGVAKGLLVATAAASGLLVSGEADAARRGYSGPPFPGKGEEGSCTPSCSGATCNTPDGCGGRCSCPTGRDCLANGTCALPNSFDYPCTCNEYPCPVDSPICYCGTLPGFIPSGGYCHSVMDCPVGSFCHSNNLDGSNAVCVPVCY